MAAAKRKPAAPSAFRIPKAKRDVFLQHVRDGRNRADAAEAVGLTGSRFRSLCRNDTRFNEAYVAAVEQGREGRRDVLRQTLWDRALAGDTPGSDRLLLVLCEAELPELEHRRRQRVDLTHSGAKGGPVEVTYVDAIDAEIRRLLDELAGVGEAPAGGVAAPGEVAAASPAAAATA